MVGPTLRRFGKVHNLKTVKGKLIGVYRGYYVNIEETFKGERIAVAALLEYQEELVNKIRSEAFLISKKSVSTVKSSNYYIEINFNRIITMKILTAILDLVIDKLTENNIQGADFCTFCGGKIDVKDYTLTNFVTIIMPAHNECIQEYNSKIDKLRSQTEEDNMTYKRTYLKGFLGALIGGIIGSILWIVVYLIGFITSLGGFLVGLGASFGYMKFGGRRGKSQIPIAVAASVIALFLGFFISYCLEIYIKLEAENVLLLDTPYIFVDLMKTNQEYSMAIIKTTLMSSVFAVIGLVGSFAGLKQKDMKSKLVK